MADIEHILSLAIGSVGPGYDAVQRRQVIIGLAQDIAAMMNEHSLEWSAVQRVLEPDGVFIAIYDGYRFEESSQRCLLTFRDKDTGLPEEKKGQPVVIRTDRCDGPLGAVMRARLDAIPKGSRVRVWKSLESFTDRSGDDAKFRVLSMIEPMSKRDDEHRSQGSATPPREPEKATGSAVPVAAPAEPSESYPSSAGAPSFGSIVEKRLAEMTAPGRVLFIRHLAMECGIYGGDYLKPEYETKVLAALERFRGAA